MKPTTLFFQIQTLCIVLLLFVGLQTNAQVKLDTTVVDTITVVDSLDTPWEILWGPDDHIWMTERPGRVSRLNPETGDLHLVASIAEAHENNGEGGLLGMALHPDFPDSAFVYVVYNYLTEDEEDYLEKLVRFTYDGDTLISPVTLLDSIKGNYDHNGSRLLIDDEYKLFMTTGDAGNREISQDLDALNGKILRMNLDGSVPDDNPIAGSYIWSWGHRNPQGLVIGPDGVMYNSEHGPASEDEINWIEKGNNYGWPGAVGFCGGAEEEQFCEDSAVAVPITQWTPTLAVGGLDYYDHDLIPEWEDHLLLATLKNSALVSIKPHEDRYSVEEEEYFSCSFGRLRDICIAPDGRVFLAVSNKDGRSYLTVPYCDKFPKALDDRIIEIKPSTSTSLTTIDESQEFKVYPNPVEEHARIVLDPSFRQGNMTIYTQSGRQVWQHELSGPVNTFNLDFLSSGIYFISVKSDGFTGRQKMIKE